MRNCLDLRKDRSPYPSCFPTENRSTLNMNNVNNRYACQICNRRFSEHRLLRSHIARIHGQSETAYRARNQQSQIVSVQSAQPSEIEETIHTSTYDRTGVEVLQYPDALPISRDVFDFYNDFKDETMQIFNRPSRLSPAWEDLSQAQRLSVEYAAKHSLAESDCRAYFDHLKEMQELSETPRDHDDLFRTFKSFHKYVVSFNKSKVVEEGWIRANINVPDIGENTTGCFRCPKKLMEKIFLDAGGLVENLIHFRESFDSDGSRTFSSPWDTKAYELYNANKPYGHIILVDFFVDGATLSKSGTQSGTFLRVRFSNIKGYSEKWYDIGIAPSVKVFLQYLSKERKRKAQMILFQRFIFLTFKDLIKASHFGCVVNGVTLLPRISMVIVDQPEERAVFCLKAKDSFMDCTLCTLPSRVFNERERGPGSQLDSTDEESHIPTRRSNSSIRNKLVQLDYKNHAKRSVPNTIRNQLKMAVHKTNPTLSPDQLREIKHFLIMNSAQDFPPALAAFDGLGSAPFLLYVTPSFDKLHVMDLGLIRMFSDLTNTVIQRDRPLPLTRLISILNNRYNDLPPSARLTKFLPFRNNKDDSQAGISGKMRRQSAPFLWVCLMGISQKAPDEDPLLQCALQLDVMNQFLCDINKIGTRQITESQVEKWQKFLFTVGSSMVDVFNVDVTTKLHRTMRHVKDHLLHHGCIRRGSTEENEYENKKFKRGFNFTNKHLDTIAPQLLRAHVHCDDVLASDEESESENDDMESGNNINTSLWSSITSKAKEKVHLLNGSQSPSQITSSILSETDSQTGRKRWRKMKSLRLDPKIVPYAKHLTFKTVFAGDVVYGCKNRHDAIEFQYESTTSMGVIESILAPNGAGFKKSWRLILVRLLSLSSPDQGNSQVVNRYGNLRYRYDLSCNNTVKTAAILISDILKPAMIVVDPFWVTQRYGVDMRFKDIPDDEEIHSEIHFFNVKGFPLTSKTQVKGITAST